MKKAGKWSYQRDESTDTGKNAQLMVYVRYEGDMDLEEKFLFCTPLTTTATGADIFNVVDNFQQEEGINWENCVKLCTDSARAGGTAPRIPRSGGGGPGLVRGPAH